ncbi:hypothetical protein FB45DRAFT_1060413 [Roridomyces roridus]|uniref:F-box domain-containing protein n=1 Tax=Roridomyces roridus TaxID=1738132 RepID=A0AAD7FLH4_9AGAR|nr:hypothetical protein FB45DRAFT_1060413 [Roridomyces roridus]
MVLTRRKRTTLSSITRLPNELLIEIIENVPKADLPSLCRVSKLLRNLTLPTLNRHVVFFIDCYPFVAFCSALIANPTRGSAIKSFALLQSDLQTVSERELGLLVRAMQTMTSLETLYLSVTALYPKLSLLTFSQLVTCKMAVTEIHPSHYAAAKQFLSRHETLTSLSVRLGYEPSVPMPAISLPNLRHLEAPSHVFKDVVSQRISAMRVFWSDKSGVPSADLIDETVTTLKALTSPTAPFISYQDFFDMRETDYIPVLDSLSRHMQHTTSLGVRARDMKRSIHLFSHLPRFSKLKYLALQCDYRRPPTPERLARAWELVRNKVDSGSINALIACPIQDTAWKKVDGLWEEYPEEEFQIQAGLDAFMVDLL